MSAQRLPPYSSLQDMKTLFPDGVKIILEGTPVRIDIGKSLQEAAGVATHIVVGKSATQPNNLIPTQPYRVRAIRTALITSAVVANRVVLIRGFDPNQSRELDLGVSPVLQAASLTFNYAFGLKGSQQSLTGSQEHGMLSDVVLPPDWLTIVFVLNADVADLVGGSFVEIEQFTQVNEP